MKAKDESEKVGLKLNIHEIKIIASGPTTLWQIEGGKVETVTDFLFLDSKITEDGDCSHEIKTPLLLERKAMTNLDSTVKKQRYHFADKGPYSQSSGFFFSFPEMDRKVGQFERYDKIFRRILR